MKRERMFVETFLVFDSVFFGQGEGGELWWKRISSDGH